MAGEQNFKVYLTFKDEATGKFIKATEEQIASMKKLGITIKKEGSAAVVDIDKMGQKMEETGRYSRYLGTEISNLAGKIGTIRNMILVWMFALRPLINTIKESIEASIQQEDAERRLAAIFAATATGSKAGIAAIKEQATAIQNLTGVRDDEIISASSILATYKLNEQQIQRILPLMVDMSKVVRSRSGEEMNLATVAKATGQAFSTNASRLQYLGITIDATTKKTHDFDTILKAIKDSVGGAAVAMAGTFSGQLKIFQAAIHDFHESLGNIITKSPIFIAVLKLMTESINNHNKALQDSQERTDNFAWAWQRTLAALVGVWVVLKGMVAIIMQIGRVIDMVILGIADFVSKVLIAVNVIIVTMLSIIPGTKKIQEGLLAAGNAIDSWRETFIGANKEIGKQFDETNKFLFDMTGNAVDIYSKIIEGSKTVAANMKIDVKGLVSDLDELQNEAGTTYNAMQTYMIETVTHMRDSLVDGFIDIAKGQFKSLSDVVVNFGNLMLKTIMQIAVNSALIKIGLGSFLGFGGGMAHAGGYMLSAESSFAYHKKFHSGGEVPAILQEGEGVLSRTGMRSLGVDNLNKLNRGEQSGGGQIINNYYIDAIDVKSFRERLQQHSDIYADASNMAIRDNNSLRQTSQRWG